MSEEIKPLTLEETMLKEEMKSRCLNKGQYIDEKAKDKFKMLCHLEDFEIQYFNLKQENQQLLETSKAYKKLLKTTMQREHQAIKVLDEIREYINNYDVFKEFGFPLMKRDEENQVKSSIDYEFQTSIKKSLLQILDKVKE